jgi:hypothetical protein
MHDIGCGNDDLCVKSRGELLFWGTALTHETAQPDKAALYVNHKKYFVAKIPIDNKRAFR